jgi:hypothetical protein
MSRRSAPRASSRRRAGNGARSAHVASCPLALRDARWLHVGAAAARAGERRLSRGQKCSHGRDRDSRLASAVRGASLSLTFPPGAHDENARDGAGRSSARRLELSGSRPARAPFLRRPLPAEGPQLVCKFAAHRARQCSSSLHIGAPAGSLASAKSMTQHSVSTSPLSTPQGGGIARSVRTGFSHLGATLRCDTSGRTGSGRRAGSRRAGSSLRSP